MELGGTVSGLERVGGVRHFTHTLVAGYNIAGSGLRKVRGGSYDSV